MNAAREKVEREGCRVCGAPPDKCDAAHVWDRSLGGGGFDDPDAIVPLCSKIKGGGGCHDAYDAHELDLLPYLTLEEELALVRAAKPKSGRGSGIERARVRAIGGGRRKRRGTGPDYQAHAVDDDAFGGF